MAGTHDPQFLGIGDFNGDERTDLAVAHDAGQRVSILLNNCDSPVSSTISLPFAVGFNEDFIGPPSFTVLRTGSLEGSATVQYSSSDATAVSTADYTAFSGTLNFAEGDTFKVINFNIVNDILDEPDEEFRITLSNATGAASLGSPSSTQILIVDGDFPPQISISNLFVPERNSLTTNSTFTVTLSAPSGLPVSVNYATANGAALSGSDYVSASGTLNFAPGETTKTIDVGIIGDTAGETDENFFLNLSNASSASIAVAQAIGMILDDDSACPAPKFQLSSNLALAQPTDAVAADFNGDNKKDLIVSSRSGNSVALFLSDGNGGFAAPASFGVGFNPGSIGVGDFNGDLKLDVVTINEGTMSVLLGNGAGGFAAATTTVAPNAKSVVVGDVNTDNKLDLALINTAVGGAGSVSILLGDGTGAFGAATSYATGQSSIFGALANLNGDNKLDVVVANLNSFNVSILHNNGDGTFGVCGKYCSRIQRPVSGDRRSQRRYKGRYCSVGIATRRQDIYFAR